MAEYTTSIEIEAAPATVFDYLVTEAGMTAWMGQHAALDPRPGGGFAVDIAGYAVRGRYIEVDPPRRVVVSWGVAGSTDLAPGASRVDFTLTPTEVGTRVDLTHSGLPDDQLDGHADGWTHFLSRLRVAGSGGDPGDDDWVPLEDRARRSSPRVPLLDRVRAELAGEPSTREVPMFGSRAFMVNERMLVAVARDDALLVRIDPARQPELVTRPGTRPAEMGAGRPMGPSWIHVTQDAVAGDADLSFWIDVAREYNALGGRATS